MSNRATGAEGTAAKLAGIAGHASEVRAAIVLEMLGCFCALLLAVTLYSITRDQDADLAMLALTFRVAEGVIGALSLSRPVGRSRGLPTVPLERSWHSRCGLASN